MIKFSTQQLNTLLLPGGIEITYTDEGKGPEVLLFVHGLSSNSLIWRQNIETLRKKYRCIALDLPGHGSSSKGKYAYSIDFFLDTLQQFAVQLDLPVCTLVGHSMGGQIAIAAAVKFPELFKKLVLAAPAGFETFTATERKLLTGFYMTQVLQSPFYKLMVDQLKQRVSEPDFASEPDLRSRFGFFQAGAPRLSSEQYLPLCIEGMLRHHAHDLLHRITQPTLVIFGHDDRLIPNRMFHHQTTEEVAREGASHIQTCRLVMLSKAGHYVQFDQPDLFNTMLQQFLVAV